MRLLDSLRLTENSAVAIVGSGGKTSTLRTLARQYNTKVLVTTTTHLGVDQIGFADYHVLVKSGDVFHTGIVNLLEGIIIFTGEIVDGSRYCAPGNVYIQDMISWGKKQTIPILIEADGARGYPLKAPDEHEPAIPFGVNHVLVVSGLSGIGKPLKEGIVFRPEIFGKVSGLLINDPITEDSLVEVLSSPFGGQKNIPKGARKSLILNQADSNDLASIGFNIAQKLTDCFDEIVICELKNCHGRQVKKRIASVSVVLLAAGEAKRMGNLKQLLDWDAKPLVRHAAEEILKSNINELIVVVGCEVENVKNALNGLNAKIVENKNWDTGLASSIQSGLAVISSHAGAVIFSVVDQPFLNWRIIDQLISKHQRTGGTIVLPSFGEMTGNPVLFDRIAFEELKSLRGDKGGRSIINKFHKETIKLRSPMPLMDLDTCAQYQEAKIIAKT